MLVGQFHPTTVTRSSSDSDVNARINLRRFQSLLRRSIIYGQVKQSDLILIVDRHLKQLVTLVNELEGRFPGGNVFVTADVGAYGSFTWGQAVNALGNRDAHFLEHVGDAVKTQWLLFIINFSLFKSGKKVLMKLLVELKIRHTLQPYNV